MPPLRTRPIALASCILGAALAAGAGCGDDGADQEAVEQTTSALVSFTPLTLLNGWTGAPFSTSSPAVGLSSGIVYLKGAMKTTGTNAVAFKLTTPYRPTSTVYLPVNLCGATKGRLMIATDGTTTVVAEGGTFSNAQCFTSLDGVSFSVSTSGYTPLTLLNGWTNAPFSTRNAAVTNIGDVIHLAGAINTSGTNALAFKLPIGFAPSTNAYLPVDLCGGSKGRLAIDIAGNVTVVAEGGVFSNAQCFTSLEGVSFPLSPGSGSGFTCLTPQNGWVGMPFSTRMPCVKNDNGIVRLLGAVNTSGTNSTLLTLPASVLPSKTVYIETDLCDGAQGRLMIDPVSGAVSVQPKGAFWTAQCFTSLEGAIFAR